MDNLGITARMTQLLTAAGLSRAEFAQLASSSADKISKSFSGKRKFSVTELAVAADIGRTSLSWLLTGKHSASPAIAARTDMEVPPPQQAIEATLARFTDAAERIDLIDGPRTLQALPALSANSRFVEEGERLAIDALRSLGSVSGGSLLERIEQAFEIDIIVTALPDGLDGCAWQSESLRIIALNSGTAWARQRFTLAHELGHILAKDAQVLIGESDVYAHNQQVSEKRANAFASRFLMPSAELAPYMAAGSVSAEDFALLVKRFRVSPSSLSWRFVTLGVFDKAEQREWGRLSASGVLLHAGMADSAAQFAAEAEAERIPPRLARRHWELYKAGEISARPVAALLGLETDDVRARRGSGEY